MDFLASKRIGWWYLQAGACVTFAAAVLLGSAANGANMVYYPFDVANMTTTPDLSGGTGKDATLQSGTSITSGVGMFGNALATTNVPNFTSAAALAENIADVDKVYNAFTLSLWIKPDVWNTTAVRTITGKMGTSSSQRGWYLEKQPSNTTVPGTANNVSQLIFAYWPTTSSSTPPPGSVQSKFSVAPDATQFTHVAITFTPNQHASMFINGILLTDVNTAANTTSQINMANNRGFEVGNRGSLNVPGFVGNIDDYALKDDTVSNQQVALIHGLGRLAGVSYGAGVTLGSEIDGVLNAYNTQGSAIAGGKNWVYSANLNQGTTVGSIGGTVAANDAYIVLGTDGSGVMIQPLAGDFDSDGDVDGADFIAWQTNYPLASGATTQQGDADGDFDVDGADFAAWQNGFPTPSSPGVSPVPEPHTIVFAVVGCMGLCFGMRLKK